MEKRMFTEDYVKTILTPFLGKKIRMRSDTIPFILETSMESSFQLELTNIGIRFILADNFYINRDLTKVFFNSFQEIDIYPFQLDKLAEVESKGTETIIADKIIQYIVKNFNPQIAVTYYTMIKSLRVEEKRFFINDVEFFVSLH